MILGILIAQFGQGFSRPDGYGFDADSNSPASSNLSAATSLTSLLSNMIGLLTVVAAISFVIYFLLGGVQWVTAGGDSSKVQKARDQMVQGVIGMVVVVISYGLIGLIGSILGFEVFDLYGQLQMIAPGGTAGGSP